MIYKYKMTWRNKSELDEWLLDEIILHIMNNEPIYKLYVAEKYRLAIIKATEIINEQYGYSAKSGSITNKLTDLIIKELKSQHEEEILQQETIKSERKEEVKTDMMKIREIGNRYRKVEFSNGYSFLQADRGNDSNGNKIVNVSVFNPSGLEIGSFNMQEAPFEEAKRDKGFEAVMAYLVDEALATQKREEV